MKKLISTLVLLAFACASNAQTNAPRGTTQIQADTADFSLKTHEIVYRGNVRVDDPQLKLTCELLTAKSSKPGAPPESIVAETNVVVVIIDEGGLTNHAFAEKLVYTLKAADGATNVTVLLTGNPRLERPGQVIRGDSIEWDKVNGRIHVANQKIELTGDMMGGGTNALPSVPVETNSVTPPPAPVETNAAATNKN